MKCRRPRWNMPPYSTKCSTAWTRKTWAESQWSAHRKRLSGPPCWIACGARQDHNSRGPTGTGLQRRRNPPADRERSCGTPSRSVIRINSNPELATCLKGSKLPTAPTGSTEVSWGPLRRLRACAPEPIAKRLIRQSHRLPDRIAGNAAAPFLHDCFPCGTASYLLHRVRHQGRRSTFRVSTAQLDQSSGAQQLERRRRIA